ncbi:MAG: glycosyltransferase family 4 protein [bacterium]
MVENKKKKILIVLDEPYPNGMACTKRVHLYAKGLIELGNDVKIIIPRATEKYLYIKNRIKKGIHDSVNFEYASKSPIRSKYFLIRKIDDVFAYFRLFFIGLTLKPDILLISGESNLKILISKLICIFIKSKLLRERSEILYYKNDKIKYTQKYFSMIMYLLFDGLIVISENLKIYFKNDLGFKKGLIKIPILLKNFNYYDNTKNNISNNFVYCGSLNDKKDGILLMLGAFAKFCENRNDYKLLMTGNIDKSPDKKIILEKINNLNLNDKVIITGYVTEKELFDYMHSALALVLAKPQNRQNKYNMATKVGEYLITGRPVILSSVDQSTEFLTNYKDAIIFDPEVDELVEKMNFIINNREKAENIGKNGRNIAVKYFDYRKQIEKLDNFLNNNLLK